MLPKTLARCFACAAVAIAAAFAFPSVALAAPARAAVGKQTHATVAKTNAPPARHPWEKSKKAKSASKTRPLKAPKTKPAKPTHPSGALHGDTHPAPLAA